MLIDLGLLGTSSCTELRRDAIKYINKSLGTIWQRIEDLHSSSYLLLLLMCSIRCSSYPTLNHRTFPSFLRPAFKMQFSYLLVFSLLTLADANPLPNSGSTQTTKCSATITANYDDLPIRPPAVVPLPLGQYRGLLYNGVGVITLGILGAPPQAGVIPASNPNVASYGLPTTTTNVTVVGGGASYKTFNPTGIAYGCEVASGQTILNVPVSCTLAFTGYKAGTPVVRQLLTYEVATGELTKALSVGRLQGFSGVDLVKFEIVVPSPVAGGNPVVAAVIDNFVYTGCS